MTLFWIPLVSGFSGLAIALSARWLTGKMIKSCARCGASCVHRHCRCCRRLFVSEYGEYHENDAIMELIIHKSGDVRGGG